MTFLPRSIVHDETTGTVPGRAIGVHQKRSWRDPLRLEIISLPMVQRPLRALLAAR